MFHLLLLCAWLPWSAAGPVGLEADVEGSGDRDSAPVRFAHFFASKAASVTSVAKSGHLLELSASAVECLGQVDASSAGHLSALPFLHHHLGYTRPANCIPMRNIFGRIYSWRLSGHGRGARCNLVPKVPACVCRGNSCQPLRTSRTSTLSSIERCMCCRLDTLACDSHWAHCRGALLCTL